MATFFCCWGLYSLIQSNSEKNFGPKEYTPNKKFYIQKTTIWSYRNFFPVLPGNGSDNSVGYIKLYYHDGTFIDEFFYDAIRFEGPRIYDDSIYLLGGYDLSWELIDIEKKLKKK